MNISVIFIIVLCAVALIALICGAFKKYSNCSPWGGSVILTLLLMQALSSVIGGGLLHGLVVLLVTPLVMLIFLIIFTMIKRSIISGAAKKQERSYYEQYASQQANMNDIVDAIDIGDESAYKKLVKNEIKVTSGGYGAVDRVFGALTLALNAVVALGIVYSLAIVFVDLSRIYGLLQIFEPILSSSAWTDWGTKLAFDLPLIALMCGCIHLGYRRGILSLINFFIVVVILALAGVAAYNLAYHVSAFKQMISSLANSSALNAVPSVGPIDKIFVARAIVMVGTFFVLLIPAIIIAVFTVRFVEKIKSSKIVTVVDGFFGALILTAFIFAVLMGLGGVLYTLQDLRALSVFNVYAKNNFLLDCMYANNALNMFFEGLPIRSFFGG